jgi:hypothetical protein
MERSWPVVVMAVLLLAPMVATCGWLYANDRWAPTLDLAVTEMRVRDVGTVHTPLVGLFGRFGKMDKDLGSHPGPLSFYLLAPVYRLLGGSYWALRVSAACLNAVGIVCVLLIARRRAGTAGVLVAGLGIAFLQVGFGLIVLTEPWIPNMPLLWFAVFLLACWSIAADDPWMLPVAAASASFCAQTHIPYAAVCAGVGLLTVVPFVVFWARATRRGSGRSYARAFVTTIATILVLWAPPIIEQLIDRPGNMTIVLDYFRNAQGQIGMEKAAPILLQHLDAVHMTAGSFFMPGGFTIFLHPRPALADRGTVFLVLWVVAVVAALGMRHRSLLALHAVVAVALVVNLLALSRIIGWPFSYLTHSAWIVGASMSLATLSTAGVAIRLLLPERIRAGAATMAAAVVIIAAGACTVRLMTQVTRAGSAVPAASEQLAALAPAAANALLERTSPGAHPRYFVSWSETLRLAGEGWGLVNELERRGLDVGVTWQFGTVFTPHRVRDPKDATARLHLATGGWIEQARTIPGAVQIAYWDGRSPEALQEFERHRASVVDVLRRLGRQDVIDQLDRRLDGSMVPGMDPVNAILMKRMAEIGVPGAVFLIPIRPS